MSQLSSELLSSEPLTPLDISHRTFPRRPGGYDRAGVSIFLGQVANEVEALLHERQALRGRVEELERELDERRQAEDEIRRAVVAAERIGHDLRENATRQCELMIEQAQTQREAIDRDSAARLAELEAGHQARMAEVEAAFRGRFADLEREHHALTLERDRAHAERTVYLERAFNERYAELTARLSAVRTEYTQFVGQYRALIQSFAELSARHLPAAEDLSLPASPLPGSPAVLTLDEPGNEEGQAGPSRDLARMEEQQFV